MNSTNTLVVISRYHEDIDWVSKLKIPYLIVNKGDPIDDPNTVCIPNDINGREAHTYIWYILQNYDNLPDSVIFLQGDPFEHNEKIIEFLDPTIIEKMPSFQPLTIQYSKTVPDQSIRHITRRNFEGFEYNIMHFGENFLDKYPEYEDAGLPLVTGWIYDALGNISIRKELHKLFEVPYKEECVTPYFFSAMFKIDKELIHKYSKDYYQRIFSLLSQHLAYVYMCERMWYAMYVEANVMIPKETDL